MKDREKPHRAFWRRKWTFSDIRTAIYILMTHSLCIFAPFHFNWKAFWVAFTLYVLVAIFGITLSYHRNLTHKSFKLPKWLEYSFAYMGVMALQVWSKHFYVNVVSYIKMILYLFGFFLVFWIILQHARRAKINLKTKNLMKKNTYFLKMTFDILTLFEKWKINFLPFWLQKTSYIYWQKFSLPLLLSIFFCLQHV